MSFSTEQQDSYTKHYSDTSQKSKRTIDFKYVPSEHYVPQDKMRQSTKSVLSEKSEILSWSKKDDVWPEHKEIKYLEEKVFPILLPVVRNCLLTAKSLNCLKLQKNIFNGIDFIAQLLYNYNPRYPERKIKNENIYLMDWVKEMLEKKPRKVYPRSHLWKEEDAATVIQAFLRGYFVRREPEVQDMRQFWKTLKKEKTEKELLEKAKLEAEAAAKRRNSFIDYAD